MDVGNGFCLSPVLQFHLHSTGLISQQSNAEKPCHLSRLQTHFLNHFLYKALEVDESSQPLFVSSDDTLPAPLSECIEFIFGSTVESIKHKCIVCSWPCNQLHDTEERQNILSFKGDVKRFCHHVISSSIGECDLLSDKSRKAYDHVSRVLNQLRPLNNAAIYCALNGTLLAALQKTPRLDNQTNGTYCWYLVSSQTILRVMMNPPSMTASSALVLILWPMTILLRVLQTVEGRT